MLQPAVVAEDVAAVHCGSEALGDITEAGQALNQFVTRGFFPAAATSCEQTHTASTGRTLGLAVVQNHVIGKLQPLRESSH